MSGRPAVFFDRDGTLMEEVHYCSEPSQVRVYPGVPEALRRLKEAGFGVFIITNQSGIGRGLMTMEQYYSVQDEFLRQAGAESIDASYFCADPPGVRSARRKPKPGMVLEAASKFGIDLAHSYFVGDKKADIDCGRRAGNTTILVLTGYGAEQNCHPNFVTDNAVAAIELILSGNATRQ